MPVLARWRMTSAASGRQVWLDALACGAPPFPLPAFSSRWGGRQGACDLTAMHVQVLVLWSIGWLRKTGAKGREENARKCGGVCRT